MTDKGASGKVSTFDDLAKDRLAQLELAAAQPNIEEWRSGFLDYMKRITEAHAAWSAFWVPRIGVGDSVRAITHAGAAIIADALVAYELNSPRAAQSARETWFFEYLKDAIEHALKEGRAAPLTDVKLTRLDG